MVTISTLMLMRFVDDDGGYDDDEQGVHFPHCTNMTKTCERARVTLLIRLIVRCLSSFIHTIDDRGYDDDDDDANDDDDDNDANDDDDDDANDDEHFPLF